LHCVICVPLSLLADYISNGVLLIFSVLSPFPVVLCTVGGARRVVTLGTQTWKKACQYTNTKNKISFLTITIEGAKFCARRAQAW